MWPTVAAIASLYWPLALGILWLVVRCVLRSVTRTDVWAAVLAGVVDRRLVIAWWVPGFCYMLLMPALLAAVLSIMPVGPTARLLVTVGIASVMLLPWETCCRLCLVLGPVCCSVPCARWCCRRCCPRLVAEDAHIV